MIDPPNHRHASRTATWLRAFGMRNRQQWAWAMYDWANSAFATTVMTVLLPIYYFDVAAAPLEPAQRTAAWGYTSALALLMIALFSPLLGGMADLSSAKKKYLTTFMMMGVTGTCLLYGIGYGQWLWASGAFIIASIGFFGGNVYYDALLTDVAEGRDADRLSLAGFSIGYLGGGTLLAINLWWISAWETWGFIDKAHAVRSSFISVGIWWLVFSLPLLIWVREQPSARAQKLTTAVAIRISLIQVLATLREIFHQKNVLYFLLAFWLYSDGIGTIMKMATTYGREIGIEQTQLISAMLMVQFLGLPLTMAYIPLLNKIPPKAALIFALSVYMLICLLGYYMTLAIHFWLLAGMVAMVQGGAQALSRSIYAALIPKGRSAEYFAFFSISSKFAGIVGPLLFAVIAQVFGQSRLSILSIILMFAGGILILQKVQVPEQATPETS